ncbi:hypothetical protein [Pseudomonas lactis]|uniref:Pectate lyase superfamily protein domain-containing protein n=1 Tax=Pseudomonas lactis TaxID=1615674 RepID=A0A7Y1MI31_9PSED|nr:hypothetical protein [Pseudomonas lactis]NNA82226.1 hypothetical protein [Pseudomonas lactis]
MTDQTQRLEIATVRAEIGSNITYKFNNDALDAAEIPTDSGPIPNLKQVIRDIKEEALDETLRAELFAAAGSGMVGFSEAQTYASGTVGDAIKTLLRRAIFIPPIGGGSDDAAAINARMAAEGAGADLFLDDGGYLQAVRLTVPECQFWHGAGGQRGTTFTKIANCDAIYVGNLSRISDLNFEGVGATFTGRGIICEGFSGSVERCRSNLMKGFALCFPGNAGGWNITSFEGSTFEPATVAAIDFGGISTVRPIFLRGIWCSGGFIDVTGSGNGCSMSEFYMTTLKHGAGAGLMHFANGRFGNTSPLIVSGGGSTFTGISFAGAVNIVSGVGHRFAGCEGEITEDSASNSNSFDARGTITNTGWTQASGTAPSIGNGSLTLNYVRSGRIVTVQLRLEFGSTTTAGDGAAPWTFALPFVATPNINADGMAGNAFDASASTDFVVFGQIPGGGSLLNFGRNGAGVRAGTPFSWAVGDRLSASLTYLVR